VLAWAPPSAAAKIACVGDSITYGYGLSDPNTQSYPAVLQSLLGASHTVRNFGVSGTTLLKSGDMPYWNEANYGASGDFAPDVVIVMLGTNDAKPQNWAHASEFSTDYDDLVAHYRGLGAFVYIAAPPPVYDPGAYDIQPDVLNNDVVPEIRQIAADVNAPLIDVYQALNGKANDFPDTVHPNADGAALIAQTVNAALSMYGFGGNAQAGAGAGGASGASGGQANTDAGRANFGGAMSGGAGVVGSTDGMSTAGNGASGLSSGGAGSGGHAGAMSGASGTSTSVGADGGALGSTSGGGNSAENQAAGGRGAGGTASTTGGFGGVAGADSTHGGNRSAPPTTTHDAGCGCRTGSTSREEHALTWLFGFAWLVIARGRRSRA
jgi:lysophospholipase L1-like esterase